MLHQISRTVLHRASKTMLYIRSQRPCRTRFQGQCCTRSQIRCCSFLYQKSSGSVTCYIRSQIQCNSNGCLVASWLHSKYSGSVTCHNVVVTSGLKDSIRPVSDGFIVICRCYGSVLHQSCMKTTMTCIAFEVMHCKLYKSYMNLVRFQNYSNVTAMLRLFLRFRVTKNVSSR